MVMMFNLLLKLSAKHSEISRITSLMEEHKLEIADGDLGTRIYIDFYSIRSSFLDDFVIV